MIGGIAMIGLDPSKNPAFSPIQICNLKSTDQNDIEIIEKTPEGLFKNFGISEA